MKNILTRFYIHYPAVLVYMLQNTEYKVSEYFKWFNRTSDFSRVMKRRRIDFTKKARALLVISYVILFLMYFVSFGLLIAAYQYFLLICALSSVALLILSPWILAIVIVLPLIVGKFLVQRPREKKLINEAREIIKNHSAFKIAIAGSYGKTTAKEIIAIVLSMGKKVAYTPGNMNTPIGISRFVKKLSGDEDVLIFEMGEEKVGDVKELSELTMPDIGVMTGISEAHLSSFGVIENTIKTIYELADYLGDRTIYKNKESSILNGQIKAGDDFAFSRQGLGKWTVTNLELHDIHGMSFDIVRGDDKLHLSTKLIGEHNIGIILVAVDIAKSLGLSNAQIEEGVALTRPFEHRLEPKHIHGAWLIDDTYNGNSEGVAAGLALLKQTEAKRRIYITPGLVEQGVKSSEIHQEIGRKVAAVADIVVLMRNSTTADIVAGLNSAGFKGELKIVDDPLNFYQNINHFVAVGDVALMQNDWTDNYA